MLLLYQYCCELSYLVLPPSLHILIDIENKILLVPLKMTFKYALRESKNFCAKLLSYPVYVDASIRFVLSPLVYRFCKQRRIYQNCMAAKTRLLCTPSDKYNMCLRIN